jgi:hypothetical protein
MNRVVNGFLEIIRYSRSVEKHRGMMTYYKGNVTVQVQEFNPICIVAGTKSYVA